MVNQSNPNKFCNDLNCPITREGITHKHDISREKKRKKEKLETVIGMTICFGIAGLVIVLSLISNVNPFSGLPLDYP